MSVSKIIVQCDGGQYGLKDCVVIPYIEPPVMPEISHFAEYGFSGTTITWGLICFVIVGLAMVAAIAMVRYRAHERKEKENVARINRKVTSCPNCMVAIP